MFWCVASHKSRRACVYYINHPRHVGQRAAAVASRPPREGSAWLRPHTTGMWSAAADDDCSARIVAWRKYPSSRVLGSRRSSSCVPSLPIDARGTAEVAARACSRLESADGWRLLKALPMIFRNSAMCFSRSACCSRTDALRNRGVYTTTHRETTHHHKRLRQKGGRTSVTERERESSVAQRKALE